MTGDFALTLPVMLAVAIASITSRALSYGTIYTTKLLRRGTDIDRTTPWRALADLKIADAMRPFRRPLPVPPPAPPSSARADGGGASSAAHGAARCPGRSCTRPTRRPCSPPSPSPRPCGSWRSTATTACPCCPPTAARYPAGSPPPTYSAAIGRQISTPQPQTAQPQLAARGGHDGPGTPAPPTPLPGYQFSEITVTAGSPAAGRKLADVTWPQHPGISPSRHRLRPPHPGLTLAPGDRVGLLTAAPGGSPERHPAGHSAIRPGSDRRSNHGRRPQSETAVRSHGHRLVTEAARAAWCSIAQGNIIYDTFDVSRRAVAASARGR